MFTISVYVLKSYIFLLNFLLDFNEKIALMNNLFEICLALNNAEILVLAGTVCTWLGYLNGSEALQQLSKQNMFNSFIF
jgi:hypothetical protein